MSVQVRRAELSDAEVVAQLFSELGYPSTTDDMMRRLPPILSSDDQRIFLATDDLGAVIGCVHVGLLVILERDLSAQLMGMVVSANHRRRGTGRALVNAAEAWGISRGCEMMYVRTNVVRPEAPAFYSGLGYTNNKTQFAFRKKLSQ